MHAEITLSVSDISTSWIQTTHLPNLRLFFTSSVEACCFAFGERRTWTRSEVWRGVFDEGFHYLLVSGFKRMVIKWHRKFVWTFFFSLETDAHFFFFFKNLNTANMSLCVLLIVLSLCSKQDSSVVINVRHWKNILSLLSFFFFGMARVKHVSMKRLNNDSPLFLTTNTDRVERYWFAA